jgi:hypothetical protein
MILPALISLLAFAQSDASGCSQSNYCTPDGWCENFTSLVDLNFALFDDSPCPGYFGPAVSTGPINVHSISLKANNYKGPINDRFDYQRFIQTTFPHTQSFSLTLLGFDGIDFNFTNSNYSYKTKWNDLNLFMKFAKFDFYLNGKRWEMSSGGGVACDETELINIFNKTNYGIFGSFTRLAMLSISFEFHSSNSDFKQWCPLVLKNANIDLLYMDQKPIRFYGRNFSHSISSVRSVSFLNFVADNLDKEILHPQVYSHLNSLAIDGNLKKIETEVFKEMKHLTNIYLLFYNLKTFIHGNGIEWMSYVNYYMPRVNISRFELECNFECLTNLSSNVSWIELQTYRSLTPNNKSFSYFPNLIPYAFPDEDFCIFSNYPFDKPVLLRIYAPGSLNCPCSMIWMFKNVALLFTINETIIVSDVCKSLITDISNFTLAFNACGFSDKYSKCQMNMTSSNQSYASYTDSFFQFYDTLYILTEIGEILKNYFDYWVLVLGFLANLTLVIVIINAYRKANLYSNNKDNQLGSIKENYFTYMLINSIINSIYCLVIFFNETLPCVPNPVGRSYINKNCLITDVCIATTGSVLKLMANVTYLQMSLNRYLLIGQDHSELLKKIGKANIVIVLIIALFTSCLLSYVFVEKENFLNHLGIQTNGLQLSDYYVPQIDSFYGYSYNDYVTLIQTLINKLPLIMGLTIVHDLISYFLFCILNLILDVMTVVKLKETLEHKASIGIQSKEKKEEKERTERRSIIMVVLNSLVNILLRIPELLSIIFFFIVNTHTNAFMIKSCFILKECNVATHISDSFFNFTMVCNIFFFYFFNKTFKFAFHLIFTFNSTKNQPKK